jgi:outer membrane biosynthesis protein TonB
LQRRLKRAWVPPKGLPNEQVTVLFKIAKTGEVSKIRLETAGRDDMWARAALHAVDNATPFRRLPDGIESAELGYRFGYFSFAR